jgi:glycosyltransferase involved in cell wall biosynthesis
MNNFNNITCSIIICTLHNIQGLEKCIASIIRQTIKPDEIIVVHGSVDDEIEESITNNFLRILQSNSILFKYVRTIKSLVIQRNIGIDNACGDIIVFLDDDVILNSDYLYHLLEAYKLKWSENLGGVQGTIIEGLQDKPWHLREIYKKIFLLANMTGSGRLFPSVNPSYCGNPKEIKRVDIFNGCMMSFRSDVLRNNRFDTNLKDFWMCDDIELSYRISRKFQLYQAPLPRLHHLSSTPSYEGHKKIACMAVFNRLYLFRLYFSNLKINWLLFFWSNIGDLFYRIWQSIVIRSAGPLLGVIEGWKLVIINKGHPYGKRVL